ncbi:hypothetical protein TNCT_399611 [Trichonephila clavata]|uniref:Uncharacterized protein n=1 Tax=Trichonephila clavata TaxID=2740835 RepID=A0A8X6KAN4_TRICU|nr:hypothetical protein TNCT_399611 [Trichonephila clavata]
MVEKRWRTVTVMVENSNSNGGESNSNGGEHNAVHRSPLKAFLSLLCAASGIKKTHSDTEAYNTSNTLALSDITLVGSNPVRVTLAFIEIKLRCLTIHSKVVVRDGMFLCRLPRRSYLARLGVKNFEKGTEENAGDVF